MYAGLNFRTLELRLGWATTIYSFQGHFGMKSILDPLHVSLRTKMSTRWNNCTRSQHEQGHADIKHLRQYQGLQDVSYS